MDSDASGTTAASQRDRLLKLAAVVGGDAPLITRLEEVTLAALELTGTDHADLTVFDPVLRRFLPPRSNRVFMHEGDDDAAAWIFEHRSHLLIEQVTEAATDTDLTLFNRDISSYLGVPVLLDGHTEAALLVFSQLPRSFDEGELDTLNALAALAGAIIDRHRLQLEVNESKRLLRRLTLVDPLTGIASASQYEQLLNREWQRAVQEGLPLALMQVDVQLESGGGTDAAPAELLLAQAAQVMRAALYRPGDLLARLDDFRLALLLPETDERGAVALARRLRRDLQQVAGTRTGGVSPVSLRIGVSAFDTLRIPRTRRLQPEDLHLRAGEALELAGSLGAGNQLFSLSLA